MVQPGIYYALEAKLFVKKCAWNSKSAWPDYVFSKNYSLMKLDDLEKYISQNNHLPGMPSSCEVEENGHHLGKVQTSLVEKTEENTLYILQLKKEIEDLKKEISLLKK